MWQFADNEFFIVCLEQLNYLALDDSFMGRLFCPNFESLTYVDQCASLKEFNKLKCRGLFFFLSEQKKLMRQV